MNHSKGDEMKIGKWVGIVLAVAALAFLITNPRLLSFLNMAQTETVSVDTIEDAEQEYELITLLPLDGIPSIDDPQFVTGAEADEQYAPDELVIGLEINGDARAYSIPFLSGHEIVNDVVDGQPIAVTW